MYDEFGNFIGGDTGTYSDFLQDDTGTSDVSSLDTSSLGGIVPAGLFGQVASPGKAAIAGMYGVGRAIGRGVGSIMVAGRAVSVRKVWDIAKRFGPEVAAAAVGMTVGDLMAVFSSSGVILSSSRRRRGRGISSRDIRCTKRVIRFTNRMVHDLGCVHRPHFRSKKHASA